MNLKNLLNDAKAKKAAHNRYLEIENLDLTAEEYMLIREDKNSIGLELMYAILEKIPNSGWMVDDSTFRFVRSSKSAVQNGFQRVSFSIALTSGSKRFFIKVFRDYYELSNFDLIKFPSLILAIQAINNAIEEIENKKRIQEDLQRQEAFMLEQKRNAEIARLEKLEAEDVEHEISAIRNKLLLIEKAEKKSAEESNFQAIRIHEHLDHFCSNLSTEVHFINLDLNLTPKLEYQIIDEIPCKAAIDENNNAIITISASYIKYCLNVRGIFHPSSCSCEYDPNTNLLIFSCASFSNALLAEVLKDFNVMQSTERNVSIRLLKLENSSTQLQRINKTLSNSMNNFLKNKTEITVFDTPYSDMPDSEILFVTKKLIESYAENVSSIIWSSKNSNVINQNNLE